MAVAEIPTLLTKRQFVAKHPAFTLGGLDWLCFNRESNGLARSGALIRVGSKRLLINEERFFAWLEAQNSEAVT